MTDEARRTVSRERLSALGAPRVSAIPEARRHTARVARLRRIIMWSVGAIVMIVAAGFGLHALSLLPVDLRFARIALQGTRITIETPKLVGYRMDGRPFEIKARVGVQDIKTPDVFELEELDVRIENSDDNSIRMTAARGIYNAKNDHADLKDGVVIRDDKNFEMRLADAAMDFKASIMKSDKPVKLSIGGGEVTASAVEFVQKERRAAFVGNVHTVLYGETDEPAGAKALEAATEPEK